MLETVSVSSDLCQSYGKYKTDRARYTYMTTPEYNILQLKTAPCLTISKRIKEALEPQNIKT